MDLKTLADTPCTEDGRSCDCDPIDRVVEDSKDYLTEPDYIGELGSDTRSFERAMDQMRAESAAATGPMDRSSDRPDFEIVGGYGRFETNGGAR